MGFQKWFKASTPLQLAIERGLKPGGNLVAELDELDDYIVKSKGDAGAICEALRAVEEGRVLPSKHGKSPLYALANLFQAVENGECEAFQVLRERGAPFLFRLARQALVHGETDGSDLLFVLKIVAGYGTSDGADLVLEAAKRSFDSDQYLWSVILEMFTIAHPEARRVFAALSDPLPGGFLAISLLDAANRFCIEGGEMRHPFDSDQGVRKLETWLREADSEHFSYAMSATAALPFVQHPRQDDLFQIAFGHPDPGVRLEGAWAAAKLERPEGIEKLIELCRNVNYSSRATAYLKELGRENAIPEESKRPDFEAKAEFAQWLAHPNELARFPDELEILDHQDLRWPTDGEVKHFWLIKYRMKDTTGLKTDDVGVGLVGSMTFCLFSYELEQRHPEDAYAIHCYWEMTHGDRITDSDVEGSSDYDSLLTQWNSGPLEEAKIIAVSELSPEVNYPRRLVGLASGRLGGRPGFAVLDGADSRWYPADELPDDPYPQTVLMMHIGRRLLGFKQAPDRKGFLKKPSALPPEQIERAYERFLSEAESGPASQRERLVGKHGLLRSHFESYVEARHLRRGGSKTKHLADAYERLLRIARQHPNEAGSLLDNFSAVGEGFEKYVNALVELQRQPEIIPLIELFTPHWQHNLGSGQLGNAAFKAGRDDIAERFCVQLKEGLEDWQRSKEMSFLAEIWHRQGKVAEARSLLVECMRKTLEDGSKAEGSDRRLFEEWFQNHRNTYLRLFPTEPLSKHGLPDTTLS